MIQNSLVLQVINIFKTCLWSCGGFSSVFLTIMWKHVFFLQLLVDIKTSSSPTLCSLITSLQSPLNVLIFFRVCPCPQINTIICISKIFKKCFIATRIHELGSQRNIWSPHWHKLLSLCAALPSSVLLRIFSLA